MKKIAYFTEDIWYSAEFFKIDHEKCTGCGSCSEVCPCGAIHPDEQNEDVFTIDFELCAECGACEAECPFEAIEEVEDAN